MLSQSQILKIAITALSVLLLVVLSTFLYLLYGPLITDKKGVSYLVKEGSSMHVVIEDLTAMQVIKHPAFFKWLVKVKKVEKNLKAGEYFFAKGTSATKLLNQIVTGKGMVYHIFTIVPGWNFKEVRRALDQNEFLTHAVNDKTLNQLMTDLGNPKLQPEGQFYPDSYFFSRGASDAMILKRAFKAMQTKLNKAWETRANNLPFKNMNEALTAASIIEKEAYFKKELPKIAGVLINRLKKNMLLQFDPTVIYGVGDQYTGKIRRVDLKAKNPYNTYVIKGLPPTPISMPSFAAIAATLHPETHDLYYFVACGDRSHLFSQNLAQHNLAIKAARKTFWYFNAALTRSYLMKSLSEDVHGHRKI